MTLPKKALDYIYYRFFKFGKLISLGLSRPHYRAAFAGSFGFFFGITTILELLGLAMNQKTMLLYLAGYFLCHYLFLRFFLNPKRYRRVMKKYDSEPFTKSVLGNIFIAAYMMLPLATFIWVKVNLR